MGRGGYGKNLFIFSFLFSACSTPFFCAEPRQFTCTSLWARWRDLRARILACWQPGQSPDILAVLRGGQIREPIDEAGAQGAWRGSRGLHNHASRCWNGRASHQRADIAPSPTLDSRGEATPATFKDRCICASRIVRTPRPGHDERNRRRRVVDRVAKSFGLGGANVTTIFEPHKA